ncbi:MAG: cellobiose phosphorylase [Lachnospiraceae bacterium]|nr:cellobiose phosphorylase [Lachnospiraceae bacterium]
MKKNRSYLALTQGNSCYRFLPSGDVFTFSNGDFLINQLPGSAMDGSLNNIYLRIYREDGLHVYPLLGIRSGSQVYASTDCLRQETIVEGILCSVSFCPVGEVWFWDITLTGKGEIVDLVYGQDLGVSASGSVLSNSLYTSQYLGNTIFEGENGYLVCSRQNMEANGSNPYVQQGTLGCRAVHYSTDGLQFFGLSAKETGRPIALSDDLPDVNLQYEFAYTALQTEKLILNEKKNFSFYGVFKQNHPKAITEIEYREEILQAREIATQKLSSETDHQSVLPPVCLRADLGRPFSSPSLSREEIDALFPQQKLVEEEKGRLYSFFTPDHAHVVTKEKELLCERPHGTIIITPPSEGLPGRHQISSTQYMYGVFNSHVVTGNTDLNKFLSTPRSFLNLERTTGQRLYVRFDEVYHLLVLPALFEMGMNYSRWFYKIASDLLIITAYTSTTHAEVALEVSSRNGCSYDFILSSHIDLCASDEIQVIRTENGLRFLSDSAVYPDLHYDIICPGLSCTASDDRIFFADGKCRDGSLLTLSFTGESHIRLLIRGELEIDTENDAAAAAKCSDSSPFVLPCVIAGERPGKGADSAPIPSERTNPDDSGFEVEKTRVLAYYGDFIRHFHLQSESHPEQASILNETAWWYAHNALIHYSMPHGLEQSGGAAWGTRDICQGPMELFWTTQHYSLARETLLTVFSHQRLQDGEWPQWFMFDRYPIDAGECHGDIVFWPLKCIADYLECSGDSTILDEAIPYSDSNGQKYPLLSHIILALDTIGETRLIEDTGLINYAGGDWDDTLQPASEELKERLVSSWTMALAYQTFSGLARALKNADEGTAQKCASLSALVRNAFETYLICDGVITGFLEHNGGNHCLLHPTDSQTGIHYRLLPMTRSIIAELVSPEQAQRNEQLILEHLKCPDGVRLMDHPAGYDGGVSHLFRRAEQAANVGREISL